MGAIIAVAPPAGWRKWRRQRYYRWLKKYGVDGRKIATNSEYVLFRLTVLFRLDSPSVQKKHYPLFFRLHFGRHELAFHEIPSYLLELREIEKGLSKFGPEEIASPDPYLEMLDFDLPPKEFQRKKRQLWAKLIQGKIPITKIASADLHFYLDMLQWAFPAKPFKTAADFFHYVFSDHRRIARTAIRKRRGIVLHL
jgi:hypothetical protein